MSRRTPFAAAALVVGAIVLAGCTSQPAATPGASAAANPDASVAIRLALEPGNLDIRQTGGVAVDQVLIDNVYQGLVGRTPEAEIVPVLASDYTVSEDGLTYEFTLREGITFHDGQELTPQDVVWSLQTRKDSADWADSARLAGVDTIEAEGQVVRLTLSEPDSSLLWNLTGRAGIIVKEDDGVDYANATNGTGPFVVSDWRQGDSVTLTRYEEYWGEPALAAEVVFAVIPDQQAAISAALAGEVDVVTGYEAALADQVESGGEFTVEIGSATDKSVLAMNSTAEPLSDERVREAIRLAIDHDAIVEAIGSGQTLYGPIPEPDPGYEDLSELAPYDPEAARALLAEAGAEDIELDLTIPSIYGAALPQILVSNLSEVGITLNVESVDFGTWLNDVYTNRDYDLSVVNHAEPRDFENWANPDYYFTYDNPEVQDLYQQSLRATDEAEAESLLAEAARIVSEDNAADWLYNWSSVVAVATNVTGMPADNVNSRINVAEITKSDG